MCKTLIIFPIIRILVLSLFDELHALDSTDTYNYHVYSVEANIAVVSVVDMNTDIQKRIYSYGNWSVRLESIDGICLESMFFDSFFHDIHLMSFIWIHSNLLWNSNRNKNWSEFIGIHSNLTRL